MQKYGKSRTIKACQSCGKPFSGSVDNHYCPECAKKKKLDTVMKIRVCQDCGSEFLGGPRAKRCPECAQYSRTHKARKPTVRPLGSVDKCQWCGLEYTVVSGRQKYCSEKCQHEAVKVWQRGHKRGYNKESGQDKKKEKRRKEQEKICAYCGRKFKANTATTFCSDFCHKEYRKLYQCRADIRRGYDRDIDKYLSKMEEYRKKVADNAES